MAVLQLANGYLGSRLYANLFDALSEQGVDSRIYVPVSTRTRWEPPAAENVIVSPCFNTADRVLYFTKQKKMYRDVQKKFDLQQISAVHAHTLFSAGYFAYRLKQTHGIPYLVAVRNTDKNIFFQYMLHLRPLGIKVLAHASRIIFLSPKYKDSILHQYVPHRLQEEIDAKSEVIPNGIDELFLNGPPAARGEIGKTLRLIYVGDLISLKNLETTVDAVNILLQQGHSVTLKVVGKIGEEKYRKLIQQHVFIDYEDRCPLEQVRQHLCSADIFVMPSHNETFGLVYAEAMSQGLPVIYTRNEGFDGHFPEGTVGFAVDSHSPQEVAEAVLKITSQYEELSKNCIGAAQTFSWGKIAARYKQIYQEVL